MSAVIEVVLGNVLNGDLNSVGLVLGFIGVVLVFFFRLPSISVLSGGSYSEIQTTLRMKVFTYVSRLGLILIGVGFLCQLFAVPAR